MGGLRRYSLIALCFGCSVMVAAGVALLSPIHYKMTLAGNFGEFRPNHFHGGIDIKTEHMEGKPIYSVAEGYIYKVSVGMNGFGKAVYVRHPNGLTSVYGHLRDFSPRIRARVRRVQQQQHNDTCEVVFRPGQMPVAANQFIAFSGNCILRYIALRTTCSWTRWSICATVLPTMSLHAYWHTRLIPCVAKVSSEA